VKAYLHEGHGAQIYSSYYKQLLLLAAVMYVDDTDLIHWSRIPGCTPEDVLSVLAASDPLLDFGEKGGRKFI
jgi:hypothetical protein